MRKYKIKLHKWVEDHKILKISPSMHKPPKLVTQTTPRPPLNCPSLYLEIAPKYKVKQSKNGKSPSNYKACTIDFKRQISLRR